MYAVIACVHGNLEALTAVLADIDAQGITDVRCLGDLIGYGPSPVECVDLVRARASLVLRGHHDEALFQGTHMFSAIHAAEVIDWSRGLLEPGLLSGPRVRARWEWLRARPLVHEEGPDLFVHGSPRSPLYEYVLLSELSAGPIEKYEEVLAAFERLLFVGHSHLPCVITGDQRGRTPRDLPDATLRLADLGGKAIVNVGAVGQPRDGDPRACYVVVDDEAVRWRRVPYDVERTIERIAACPRVHPRFGERLRLGV
jgi:diadenosine tetraphosphatase ApaH/serine/threonine PP2A family protein phosphatase